MLSYSVPKPVVPKGLGRHNGAAAGGKISPSLSWKKKKHKSAIKNALIIQRGARGFSEPNNLLESNFNYLFSCIKIGKKNE